jgi:hypothetical protein
MMHVKQRVSKDKICYYAYELCNGDFVELGGKNLRVGDCCTGRR